MADPPTRRWSRDFHADFDIEDPELNEHYEEIVDDLVRHCPVARAPGYGGYLVVSDYETVRTCAQDAASLSNERDGVLLDPVGTRPRMIPAELDAPAQQEWRRILNPLLTPRQVARHEPAIRRACRQLIAELPEDEAFDIVDAFCGPLPGTIFFREVLGMPDDDMPVLRRLSNEVVCGPRQSRGAAYEELTGHIRRYLDDRRSRPPQGDMVDAILGAEIGGRPAEPEDQLSCATLLAMGGLNTTTVVLAGGVHHFARHPEHRARVLADPDLMGRAIEEIIRLYAPAFAVARRATRAMDIGGEPVAEGQMVLLALGAACRDPRVFPEPQELHLDDGVRAHATFGLGPHRCVGSHLARLEIRIAFEELLGTLDRLELDGEPRLTTGLLRDFDSLPVRVTRRAPDPAPAA